MCPLVLIMLLFVAKPLYSEREDACYGIYGTDSAMPIHVQLHCLSNQIIAAVSDCIAIQMRQRRPYAHTGWVNGIWTQRQHCILCA